MYNGILCVFTTALSPSLALPRLADLDPKISYYIFICGVIAGQRFEWHLLDEARHRHHHTGGRGECRRNWLIDKQGIALAFD